jgi:PAS domain S-box-containing protein/diguanylate cyclase (GGDEF)-like protein
VSGNEMSFSFMVKTVSGWLLCLSIICLSPPGALALNNITVGFEENHPIAFTGKSGHPTGISPDLLGYIAKQEGWQINWKSCRWETCLEQLNSGQIDLLVGIGHTKERESLYSFNAEAVLVNWGQLYAAKNLNIFSLPDLEGKRVALVPTDSHGKAFIELLTRFSIKARIQQSASYSEAVQAVVAGKADAAVVNRIYPLKPEEAVKVEQTTIIFNPVQNKYAVLKGKHPDLLAAIDQQMASLKADGKSYYHSNLASWLAIPANLSTPAWIWWAMAGGMLSVAGASGWWRYKSLKKQATSLKLLSVAVEQSANTIVITDNNGLIQYANQSFEKMTGYSVKDALGQTPRVLKSGVHLPEYYKEVWDTILAGETWQGYFCNKHKSGTTFWESTVITPVRDDSGKITRFVAVKEDITKRKQYEEELHRKANYDELTGLPNRNMLITRITDTIADSGRCCNKVWLMFLDITNFNMIVSGLGHIMADNLLQAVAERLTSLLKSEDLLARFGVNQFAIAPLHLCKNTTDECTTDGCLATRLMDCFNRPFHLKGHEIFVSACMGIAVYPEDGQNPEALLRSAAAARYQAKKRGHNTFERYNHALTSEMRADMALENRLRHALERNEFVVHYQPQQDMASGRVVAFEALLRWQPQEGEPAFPDRFIPILEATGMIVPVGAWVLRQVCHQVVEWSKTGIPIRHASVNLSFRQFQRPDIVEQVLAIITETGVDPTTICLELTESVMMDEPEKTTQKMAALQAAGISLSMDDFGTGYSSLAYLSKISINELKIDRSFVMTLPKSNTTLVTTILGMADSLGLRVVAEGVETEAQRDFLKTAGCDMLQGYLLSRPLPKEQFAAFIIRQNSTTASAA